VRTWNYTKSRLISCMGNVITCVGSQGIATELVRNPEGWKPVRRSRQEDNTIFTRIIPSPMI
jgi:hypothetical protein